jgi:hypothetical protein
MNLPFVVMVAVVDTLAYKMNGLDFVFVIEVNWY